MDKLRTDVAIVGAGNAALSAALAAADAGAEVVVLEAAPEAERGGNSAFTAGAMRVTYDGVADIQKLVPDLSEADIKSADFGSYSFDDYFDDMARITQHRADPDLLEILIRIANAPGRKVTRVSPRRGIRDRAAGVRASCVRLIGP